MALPFLIPCGTDQVTRSALALSSTDQGCSCGTDQVTRSALALPSTDQGCSCGTDRSHAKRASAVLNGLSDVGCPADAAPLTLRYADDALLVFDKPAGLLSVPGRGDDKQDCLSARARAQYPDALVVHRLDMATSGLMLMARGPDHQRLLSMAFAARQVRKGYVALVDGRVQLDAGATRTIDLPIGVDWPNRPKRVIDFARGKASVTGLRVLSHDIDGCSTRVALEPLTGRSHQLRLHMQASGHPILGDALYASPRVQARLGRLALHAESLEFAHPRSGRWLRLRSPPDF